MSVGRAPRADPLSKEHCTMSRSPFIRRAATAAATVLVSTAGAVAAAGTSASAEPSRHAVYTLSNASTGNAVLAYRDAGTVRLLRSVRLPPAAPATTVAL